MNILKYFRNTTVGTITIDGIAFAPSANVSIFSDAKILTNLADVGLIGLRLSSGDFVGVDDSLNALSSATAIKEYSEEVNLAASPSKVFSGAVTKESTGFRYPDLVTITGNGDRTVTVGGFSEAYWQGSQIASLLSGYTSGVHGTDTSKTYYLSYDGASIAWSDALWPFYNLQIAIAEYDPTNARWYYIRECHGLMEWQVHQEFHGVIGTYKVSGGTIPSASYVLNSTTAANRRPNVNETTIADEDLPSVLATLTSKSYMQYRLNGGNADPVFTAAAADIVSLSTNNPYYNQFTSGAWQQTLMPSNSVSTIWLYAQPVASEAISQQYRYLWVQPQWITQASGSSAGAISSAVTAELSRISSELNLGRLIASEMIGIARFVIVYTSSNWSLQNVSLLTGSKALQAWAAPPGGGGVFEEWWRAGNLAQPSNTIGLMYKTPKTGTNDATAGWAQPLSSPYDSYNNGALDPFIAAETGKLTEIRIFFAAAATAVADVGSSPTIRIEFFKVNASGTGRDSLGTRDIPISPTGVGVYNNVGSASPQTALYDMADISVNAGEMIGWEFINLNSTNNNINAVSRMMTAVHFVADA